MAAASAVPEEILAEDGEHLADQVDEAEMAAAVNEAMRVATMSVESWPIDQVYPYASNARRISDLAVEKVAASLRAFGWRQPIVVDEHGTILAGHTRHLAARRLGLKSVPVHVARDLTPTQARAYRLADNRTAEETEWDREILGIELAALDEIGLDLAMSGIGFDPSELAGLLEPQAPPAEQQDQAAEEFQVVILCRDQADMDRTVADLKARGLRVKE